MRKKRIHRVIALMLAFMIMLSSSQIALISAKATEPDMPIGVTSFEDDTPEPADVPAYYTETTVSGNGKTVYLFYGRDEAAYYRIYGKISEVTGFYSCNQYGESIDESGPVDLDDEYMMLAPYVLVGETFTGEWPNEDYTEDTVMSTKLGYPVYVYPDQDGGSQYRIYGSIDNVENSETTFGWYKADSDGQIEFDMIVDIEKDSINLWIKGFIEEAAPAEVPEFYGTPVTKDGEATIYQRISVWSYDDRNGVRRYRVYGSINNGEAGFYECDADGNVGYPAVRIDLADEEANLSPLTTGPGGVLVPGEAYIKALDIINIIDGTVPFDNDNLPGNDKEKDNKIVRSFDQVSYTLELTAAVKPGSQYTSFEEGKLYIRAELPMTSDKAVFDLADSKVSSWLENGQVTEENGTQILTGSCRLERDEDGNPGISANSKKLVIVVNVKAATQGEVIEPVFTVWLEGNDENPENEMYGGRQVIANGDKSVKVSSAAKYNVQLKKTNILDYLDTFDLDSGDFADDNSVNTVYGRITNYGVTLQIYNDQITGKGFRGVEIPSGPIEFDIVLKLEETVDNIIKDITGTTPPVFWDIKPNNTLSAYGTANNRMMRWNGAIHTDTAATAPYSFEGVRPGNYQSFNTVYQGGSYQVKTIADKPNAVRVSVENYAIDFDNMDFVTNNCSGSIGEPKSYGEEKGVWCFSAACFQIITPLPSTIEAESTYYLTVSDENLKMTGSDGEMEPVTQMYSGDDNERNQMIQQPQGSFNNRNWVTIKNATNPLSSQQGLYSDYNQGDAWTMPGSEIELWGGFIVGSSNDKSLWVRSVDILQKFDDKAFEVISNQSGKIDSLFSSNNPTPSGFTYTLLYAAKPDGTGWIDDDEMNQCKEDQLIYYQTMEDLLNDGKTCVAVLIEGRNGTGMPGLIECVGFNVRVKDDVEIGKVYQTTNIVRVWSQEGGLSEEYTRVTEGIKTEDYPPTSGVIHRLYKKTEYDENRMIKAGTHSNSYTGGQSILMVGANADIIKSVDQVETDGKAKTSYNLDTGQRQVDYVLTPSLDTGKDYGGSVNKLTNVTIIDTLPKDITYISGTALYGDSLCEPLISMVTVTKDGKTYDVQQLKWVLEDVPVAEPLDQIHFSCLIGDASDPANDVAHGDTFNNVVTIQADCDGRVISDTNGNRAQYGIQVSKLNATKLLKAVEKPRYEAGDDIVYTLTYNNEGNTPLMGVNLMDILPYLNDGRGSDFDGGYWIEGIELSSTQPDLSGYQLYYSLDETVRQQSAGTADYTQSFWTEVTNTSAAGSQKSFYVGSSADQISPKALLLYGDVRGHETITVKITLKPFNNQAGNVYGNDCTVYTSGIIDELQSPPVQARVVNRTISGTAWLDRNKNGRRDSGEERLKDVRVRLWDAAGNEVTTDITGNAIGPVYTDGNGNYEFTYLPAGTYQVTFESSAQVNLEDFILTQKWAADVPSSVSSDAEAVFKASGALDYGVIKDIVLPELDEMKVHHYTVPYQNAGFYAPLYFTKEASPAGSTADGEPSVVKEGDIITYTLKVESPAISHKNITVSVIDEIPVGLSFIQGSITYQLEGGNIVPVSDAAYNKAENMITWPEVTIPAGVSLFSFKVVVDKLPDDIDERTFSNYGVMKDRDGEEEYPPTEKVVHTVYKRRAEIEKTAALVDRDEDNLETILPENSGSQDNPVDTAKGQVVEYRITVKGKGSEELKSGEIIVSDVIPEGTTYIPGSMTAVFRNSNDPWNAYPGSTAAVISQSYTDLSAEYDQPAAGCRWVIDSLSSGEEAYLTFRVMAPLSTNLEATPEYETIRIFENTARLRDKEMSERTYRETFTDIDGNTYMIGEAVYEEDEYIIDSNTTYHVVKEPLVSATKSSTPERSDGAAAVVKEGDTITYYITLTNSGDAQADYIKVLDFVPEHTTLVPDSITEGGNIISGLDGAATRIEWTVKELDAGDVITLSFAVTVDPLGSDEGARLLKNTAFYKVTEDPDDPEEPDIPTNEVVHQMTTFVKYSDPAGGENEADAVYIKQGENILYTLQLTTDEVLHGIRISDVIPDGMLFVNGSISYTNPDGQKIAIDDSAFDSENRKVTWPVIDAGTGITRFQFEVIVDRLPGSVYSKIYINQALLEYQDESEAPIESNRVTHKTNRGETDIHKTAATIDQDQYGNEIMNPQDTGTELEPVVTKAGQIVEYTLTVNRKADPENISGKIVVCDFIPEGTTFIESSISGKIVSLNNNSKAVIESMTYEIIADKNGQKRPAVQWVISGMADGESGELKFRVQAPFETDSDELTVDFRNTAGLSDEEGDKDSGTTWHQVRYPLLETLKYSNYKEGSTVKSGDIITYSIDVTNHGKADSGVVIIKDTIPQYTSYVDKSASSNRENVSFTETKENGRPVLIWIVDSLKPGETVTVTFKVKVDEMDGNGTRLIENTAKIKQVPDNREPDHEAKKDEDYKDTNKVTLKQDRNKTGGIGIKTGDFMNLKLIYIVIIISLGTVLLILLKRKRYHR